LKQFATFTTVYFNQIKRQCTIENIQEYYKNIFNYFIAQYQNHWILLDNTAVVFTLNYLIHTNKEDGLIALWFDFLAHKILKNENHFSEKGIAFSILIAQDEVNITDKYLCVLDNIKPYEMIDFFRGVFYIDKHTIQNKFFVRKINDWLLQLSEEEFFQQVFLLRTIFSQLDESERKLFYT
jgi:hypothetical protein